MTAENEIGKEPLADHGPKALSRSRQDYYRELKANLATSEGRADARLDLLTFLAMMIKLCQDDLANAAENGLEPTGRNSAKLAPVYANSLARILRDWPKTEPRRVNAIDVAAQEGLARLRASQPGADKPEAHADTDTSETSEDDKS